MADWKVPPPEHVGALCRGLPCGCPPGRGHNHPDWIAWQQHERESDAEANGGLGTQEADR